MIVNNKYKISWHHQNNGNTKSKRKKSSSQCIIQDITHPVQTYTSISICSKDDNFDKKEGIFISFKRAVTQVPDKEDRKAIWKAFYNRVNIQNIKYYKGKKYEKIITSKIKLTGIIDYFNSIGLVIPEYIQEQMLSKGKWIPVEIYKTMYHNPDGSIWVRTQQEFKELFKDKPDESQIS